MHEVTGSIPAAPTKETPSNFGGVFVFPCIFKGLSAILLLLKNKCFTPKNYIFYRYATRNATRNAVNLYDARIPAKSVAAALAKAIRTKGKKAQPHHLKHGRQSLYMRNHKENTRKRYKRRLQVFSLWYGRVNQRSAVNESFTVLPKRFLNHIREPLRLSIKYRAAV